MIVYITIFTISLILLICTIIFIKRILNRIKEENEDDSDLQFIPENDAEKEALLPIDGVPYKINPYLVRKQKVSLNNVIELKNLHRLKEIAFKKMEQIDEPSVLKALASEVEEIEYELQDKWGFPRDNTQHRWFDVPKCLCPKFDNEDVMGSKISFKTMECPIHS